MPCPTTSGAPPRLLTLVLTKAPPGLGWQQRHPRAGVGVPGAEGRVLSAVVPQPKPTKGRMRIHCLENVDKALQFLKEQRVHLENVGSHDIVDGNHRLVLGLIWTIILRFQVGLGGWGAPLSSAPNGSFPSGTPLPWMSSVNPGMSFCLQIQDIIVQTQEGRETRSARDALLLWCQMKTAG